MMNDTVKTLTVFSAVLLPLTFISSIFGMNGLDLNNIWNMPSGFVVVTAIMIVAAIALILFLKAKQWILVREDAKQTKQEGKDKQMQH